MKTLFKVQAVVNAIEELTLTNHEYYSTFEYKSRNSLFIKTYSVEQTLALMTILKHGNGYSLYLKNNNTIEVLELPFDDVQNESED